MTQGRHDQRRHHGGRQGQGEDPEAGPPVALERGRAQGQGDGSEHDHHGGSRDEGDQDRLEQAERHDGAHGLVPDAPVGQPPAPTGRARPGGRAPPAAAGYRAENGAVPVARNRQASTHGAPA